MQQKYSDARELVELSKLYKDQKTSGLWDIDNLVLRACPFCSAIGETRYIRPDRLQVRWCNHCSTYFVSPSPTEEDINQYYARYSINANIPMSKSDAQLILSVVPFNDFRLIEISSIVEPHCKNVLDVGFSNGAALVGFKKLGANVEGIDPDPDAVSFVRDELGIESVRNCKIEDFDAEITYDIVWMSAIIEHPLNPLSMLKKAKKLLAPKGILAISTPNGSFARCQEEPPIFRTSFDHMQYLSFKTCNYIANKLGLDLVHLEGYESHFFDPPQTHSVSVITDYFNKNKYTHPIYNTALTTFRKVPGFTTINTIRTRTDLRSGQDLLFCILQNSPKEVL